MLYRTTENYNEDVKTNNRTATGVVEECCFNKLQSSTGFHVVHNYVVDMSHDILEGIANYVLPGLLVEICLTKKYITVHMLNERISNYKFDHSSKPSFIQKDHINAGTIRQNMVQMLNLITCLPGLVADKVNPTNEKWQTFILLRTITVFLMSEKIDIDSLPYLRELIAEFLYCYQKTFQHNLTAKFHILTHYPYIIT